MNSLVALPNGLGGRTGVFDGLLYIGTFPSPAEAQAFIRRALQIETGAYWFKFLLGLDMLGAALLFRDPDVTISSLTGLALRGPCPPRWARALGGCLDWLQADHCELAIAHDIMRAYAARQLLGVK